jgi:eukaryotic-like serine/threonine-protein kinase
MKPLSDKAVEKLRDTPEEPNLQGTNYKLLERVARGGMGVVYAAEDERLHRRVALKVLDATGTDRDLAQRLLHEARVLARLEHPGIVPVHDVGTLDDGRVFYAMKFVEGRRLDEHIEGVASVPDRLRLFLRICEAVAFAHARGVLHRDLKPANVMVGSFGEVLVMDWGLAKVLADSESASKKDLTREASVNRRQVEANESAQTEHGTVMGTPGYMSPEQARGEVGRLDGRSDVYSLGVLLRFLVCTGAEGSRQKIERALEAICAKAAAEKPEDRYASVPELGMDVSRFLDGLAVSARPETAWDQTARFYRKYRFFILLMAAYLVMRIALILFFRK